MVEYRCPKCKSRKSSWMGWVMATDGIQRHRRKCGKCARTWLVKVAESGVGVIGAERDVPHGVVLCVVCESLRSGGGGCQFWAESLYSSKKHGGIFSIDVEVEPGDLADWCHRCLGVASECRVEGVMSLSEYIVNDGVYPKEGSKHPMVILEARKVSLANVRNAGKLVDSGSEVVQEQQKLEQGLKDKGAVNE